MTEQLSLSLGRVKMHLVGRRELERRGSGGWPWAGTFAHSRRLVSAWLALHRAQIEAAVLSRLSRSDAEK